MKASTRKFFKNSLKKKVDFYCFRKRTLTSESEQFYEWTFSRIMNIGASKFSTHNKNSKKSLIAITWKYSKFPRRCWKCVFEFIMMKHGLLFAHTRTYLFVPRLTIFHLKRISSVVFLMRISPPISLKFYSSVVTYTRESEHSWWCSFLWSGREKIAAIFAVTTIIQHHLLSYATFFYIGSHLWCEMTIWRKKFAHFTICGMVCMLAIYRWWHFNILGWYRDFIASELPRQKSPFFRVEFFMHQKIPIDS